MFPSAPMDGRHTTTTQKRMDDLSGMLILTMASVFVGFLLFGAAFWGFMYGWSRRLVWGLVIGAFAMATVVPVIIAVFHAASGS